MSFVSPELERMAERAKLPIKVSHDGEQFTVQSHCRVWFPPTVWGANWIYRTLIDELSPNPDASSGNSGCCSVLSSPGGEL